MIFDIKSSYIVQEHNYNIRDLEKRKEIKKIKTYRPVSTH